LGRQKLRRPAKNPFSRGPLTSANGARKRERSINFKPKRRGSARVKVGRKGKLAHHLTSKEEDTPSAAGGGAGRGPPIKPSKMKGNS